MYKAQKYEHIHTSQFFNERVCFPRMLLVELSGATIGRIMDDNAKIQTMGAGELFAYEVPPAEPDDDEDLPQHNG